MKQAQLATMDPHLRDARTRGIPFLGSGAVYPVETSVIEIRPFAIPDGWPRAFGMDIGWNRTAAIWGAWDRSNDIVYLYDEHYVAEETPQVHADAIKGSGVKSSLRAPWIRGVIDPASKGRGQRDGEQLLETYRNLGLELEVAVNAVEAGIRQVWLRLSSGRLKVFSTLQYFFKEYLLYRRDENGKIIQSKARPDHLMDACFGGETRVITESGEVQISSLVGSSGKVLGPTGWSDYSNCRMYRANAVCVEVLFCDGRKVICTPDHEFLSESGKWIMAKDLAGTYVYDVISQGICGESLAQQFRNSMACGITSVGDISVEQAKSKNYSIESFIHQFTDLFRKASTFITSTMIPPIMTLAILELLSGMSTCGITMDSPNEDGRLDLECGKLGRLPIGGMVPRMELRGIKSTQKCPWPSAIFETLQKIARFAESLSWPPEAMELGCAFAQASAEPHGVGRSALITNQETASHAQRNSLSTNSRKLNTARNSVRGLLVKGVRPASQQDTYCLVASKDHAFAIEGGLIVHNCRYLIVSGFDHMREVPYQDKDSTREWGDPYQMSASSWMAS